MMYTNRKTKKHSIKQNKKKSSFRNINSQRKPKFNQRTNRQYSDNSTKFYDTVKEKLFDVLGGKKCHSCGFKDQRALGFTLHGDPTTFDQVKRGGFAASWRKYISEPELARKEIKILCLNCNAIREPQIKKEAVKKTKKRSKFFPRKENTNIIHEN